MLEIVLPKKPDARLDKKRGEYYLRVRTRKRNSKEDLAADRVWLGVQKGATPDEISAALTSSVASLQMKGATHRRRETIVRKQKKRLSILRSTKNSWTDGRDKDLGIARTVVKRVIFKVHLPDPLNDGKKIPLGSFSTRKEAREVRNRKYRELREQVLPCALCGVPAANHAGRLTHFSGQCPNQISLPRCIRPLYQVILWNNVFSKGGGPWGKLTGEDLCYMGMTYLGPRGKNYYGRTEVEFDTRLAKNYVKERPPVEEDEVGFE